MKITAEVPVKKYLVGFLNNEFGEECMLDARNPLARVLFSYLQVREKGALPKINETHVYYKVHIPVRYFVLYRVSCISEQGMWELGDWFEDYFDRMLKEYITSRIDLKSKKEISEILVNKQKKSLIQIEGSVIDFLKKNNIPEEIMHPETLLKRFTRMKNKRSILV